MKSLKDLLSAISNYTGVTADSREVKPGYIYVAVKGTKVDGAEFIGEAIQKGATATVAEMGGSVTVDNARLALARLAAAFYTYQPENMVAVTGTDGKTSTADFFRQLCALSGHKAASIGTLGVIGGAKDYPALNTTPDPVLLARTLAELAAGGVTHLCMEASSHGLDQSRLHGVRVKAAAFTNLTRDHLDYHGSLENYFAAKLKLFSEVLIDGGVAVVNADDMHSAAIADICQSRNLPLRSFGLAGADYRIDDTDLKPASIGVRAIFHRKPIAFELPMVGRFQVMNLLAAIGLAEAVGVPLEKLLAAIPHLKPVPGRLELAASKGNAPVFVDYAHTPAALKNILTVARPHITGKLWVVFGAGGDRDKGKRPEMGKIAAQYADFAVVTDDNPRTERPETIRAEILAPLSAQARERVAEMGGRREAIAYAIARLEPGDGLVIAGKGHEDHQIIGDKKFPFDDREVARESVL